MSPATAAPQVNSPRPRGLQLIGSQARLLLLIPAADFVFIVGVFIYLGAGAEWDSGLVGLIAYNLVSPVALAVLVVLTAGIWPRGMPVTAVTCVLFSGLLVAAVFDMGRSSTGVLLLLVLPLWFCVALVPFAGLGVLVHQLRGHKEAALPHPKGDPADL